MTWSQNDSIVAMKSSSMDFQSSFPLINNSTYSQTTGQLLTNSEIGKNKQALSSQSSFNTGAFLRHNSITLPNTSTKTEKFFNKSLDDNNNDKVQLTGTNDDSLLITSSDYDFCRNPLVLANININILSNRSSAFLPTSARLQSTLASIYQQRSKKNHVSSDVTQTPTNLQLCSRKLNGSSAQALKNRMSYQKKTDRKLHPPPPSQLSSYNCLAGTSRLASDAFGNVTNSMSKLATQRLTLKETSEKKKKFYHRQQKILNKTDLNTTLSNNLLAMTDSDFAEDIPNALEELAYTGQSTLERQLLETLRTQRRQQSRYRLLPINRAPDL